MNALLRAHFALFLVALIYGGNYSIAKVVMDGGHLTPLPFILLRVTCGTVLFWLFHAIFIRERIRRADLGRLALCGLFGVSLNQMFFFTGLDLTTPIDASLMMTTTPILVLIISALVLGESITWKKIVGIVLGASGAAFLIGYGQAIRFDREVAIGNLFILLNASFFGIYLVLVKQLMRRYQALTVVKWVFTFGLLLVIPFGWSGLMEAEWQRFDLPVWGSIAYVLLGTTFLAYLLNALALKVVNPSVVSIYIYLQPLLATGFALLMDKDTLDPVKVASGAAIFAGVYLVSRPGGRSRLQPEATNGGPRGD